MQDLREPFRLSPDIRATIATLPPGDVYGLVVAGDHPHAGEVAVVHTTAPITEGNFAVREEVYYSRLRGCGWCDIARLVRCSEATARKILERYTADHGLPLITNEQAEAGRRQEQCRQRAELAAQREEYKRAKAAKRAL